MKSVVSKLLSVSMLLTGSVACKDDDEAIVRPTFASRDFLAQEINTVYMESTGCGKAICPPVPVYGSTFGQVTPRGDIIVQRLNGTYGGATVILNGAHPDARIPPAVTYRPGAPLGGWTWNSYGEHYQGEWIPGTPGVACEGPCLEQLSQRWGFPPRVTQELYKKSRQLDLAGLSVKAQTRTLQDIYGFDKRDLGAIRLLGIELLGARENESVYNDGINQRNAYDNSLKSLGLKIAGYKEEESMERKLERFRPYGVKFARHLERTTGERVCPQAATRFLYRNSQYITQ